ncbi:MAG: LacI family DNA-binding transcriptional regulator [Phycisphaerales bacterium]|nr:LacI family DNA-binding transcriptional regulator [Phycisphaerales bacterium]
MRLKHAKRRTARAAPGPGRNASIQDVAASANVSIATVSRVLNTPDLVAADTAERVRRAIDQLNFRPNRFAQGLMTRRSRILGVGVPDLHGEFYSALLRGADDEARRRGYHLLVTSGVGGKSSDGHMGAMLGLVDGVALMITEPNEKLLEVTRRSDLPIVLLDAEVNGAVRDTILVDHEAGAAEAAQHLLKTVEPSRCFFVGGPRENFDTARRAKAFADAVRMHIAARTPPRAGDTTVLGPDQIVYGDYSVNWGGIWARDCIACGRLEGAGVLAGNDEIAYGIMHAALDAGLSVPGDVKIIGFDDTRLCSLVRPTLSTVRVPLQDIGAAAVSALIRRVETPDAEPQRIRLKTTLINRESGG